MKNDVMPLLLLLTLLCLPTFLFSQYWNHPLAELEERIVAGDKDALFDIAHYFDSDKKLIQYIDLKEWPTKESYIAKKIVLENCQFLATEFIINDSTSGQQFFDFLFLHRRQIFFSKEATFFMMTPIENRTVEVDIRAIPESKKKELQAKVEGLLSLEWVKAQKIDSLIKQRNPKVLLSIAIQLFKNRRNDNNFNYPQSYLDLIQWFTETMISVQNTQGKTSGLVDHFFDHNSRFNLLIYFSKYYHQYTWNEQKSCFVNPFHKIRIPEKEELLFELLSNRQDSVAMDAFIQLTNSRPKVVTKIANEYFDFSMSKNYSIPIFPCSFLKQLVLLTAYCREREIDYSGSKILREEILKLSEPLLSLDERKDIENKLIETLTLKEVTVLEYWAIVYQNHWFMPKSAKRVLDAFYEKHWPELLANETQLEFYLKKAKFFSNLQIIGYYNDYLKRFKKGGLAEVSALPAKTGLDEDVKKQIAQLIMLHLPVYRLI